MLQESEPPSQAAAVPSLQVHRIQVEEQLSGLKAGKRDSHNSVKRARTDAIGRVWDWLNADHPVGLQSQPSFSLGEALSGSVKGEDGVGFGSPKSVHPIVNIAAAVGIPYHEARSVDLTSDSNQQTVGSVLGLSCPPHGVVKLAEQQHGGPSETGRPLSVGKGAAGA